jgi:hypothetical protein
MDSENDYDIIPINNSCSTINNSTVTVSSPGSATSYTNQDITNINNQHAVSGQYDNVDNLTVKPLYGGILKNNNILFTIKFRNKEINIEAFNEKCAIKIFLNNKIYKKDHLLEIYNKNKCSIYVIKNGYKNKFKKIN